MKDNEIKYLNHILKGEFLDIENFDHFIQDTDDPALKKKLQDMQRKHQTHALQLTNRIQQLGGNPSNSAGMAGVISEIKQKALPKKYIDNNLMKHAIEGEEIGVRSYNEAIEKLQDPADKQLIQGMLADTKGIINELNSCLH